MNYWLKCEGSSESPIQDDWRSEFEEHDFADQMLSKFPRRPRIEEGDVLLCYAIGSARAHGEGRVFAGQRVLSRNPQRSHSDQFPWAVRVRYTHGTTRLSDAPTLSDIGVEPSSVRRQSHIRLTQEKAERGLAKMPEMRDWRK